MAIVTFGLQDLKELGVPRDKLEYVVDRLGMSLERIDANEVFIDITPNRPDMLHITGFAKAAQYLLGRKSPKENFYSITKDPILKVNVTGAAKIQPFIAVAVVKNVNLQGSRLKNLVNFTEKFCDTYGRKRRKLSMGLYNLDAISGQLTYDAVPDAEFVPLGSSKTMNILKILKEHQKGIEYSDILGKAKRYPILKDSKNVLALIPIVNSEDTKVTADTRNLLVDITANSRNAAEQAMDLMACTFIDMGAGVYPCEIVYKNKAIVTPNLEYRSIRIRKSKSENTLGFWLDDGEVISLVNKMGYAGAKYGKYTLVYIPPYRLDVLNEQDIIEDIAIAYGYDKIAPMPIIGSAIGTPDQLNGYINRVSGLMVGLGFSEAMNPYLTNEAMNFDKVGRKRDEKSIITVAYAKTESITMLRTDILPSLMENLENSINEKMPQKLFEIGKVFHLYNGKVAEVTNLAMVNVHSKANYSEMKSVVLQFLKFAGVTDYKLKELKDGAFIEGRAAQIALGNGIIGHFGEIHPKVLQNFKIEEPVVAAELMLG